MLGNTRLLNVLVSATGASLAVQVLAFARQILVAACFGIGRDFDAYVVVYAIATYAVFSFGAVFDTIAVPHLVRAREKKSAEAAAALAATIFRISIGLGAVASALFVIAVPLLTPVIATGFSPAERAELAALAWYFLPWTLVCLPYYAAAARHKMEWRFNRVFAAEILIVAVSIGSLAIWHADIRYLPLAYAVGYAAGLLLLIAGAGLVAPKSSAERPPIGPILRNMAELFGANQSGSLASVVDRHVQSFVPAGGVAAINYSAQLVNALATLLAFRDAFVVPLAQETDQSAKLERLLCGMVLIAAPLAGIVACLAPEIVTVLLQRGRFDAAASDLTAQVLRINALGLLSGAVFLPLMRMLQILDRIHLTHLLFLTLAASCALLGYLLVVQLHLGVRGVALMQVASGIITCILAAYLVRRCGIRPSWRRVLGYLLLASAVSGAAFVVGTFVTARLDDPWGRLVAGGATYALVVLVLYAPAAPRLRRIVLGSASGQQHAR